MSVAPVILEVESVEASLNDMANLKLGSSCACNENSNTCCCQLKSKEDRKKSTPYPYFWRKTQNNPFLKSKRPWRRKLNGAFEILQPSKLKFIVGPSTGLESNFDDDCASLPIVGEESDVSSSMLSSCASELSPGLNVHSSALPLQGIPEPVLSKGSTMSLPDFTSLSLKSNEATSSYGVVTRKKASADLSDGSNVELSGALLNFKLDGSSRARCGGRTAKWKSRMRGKFRQRSLPPILEDAESDYLTSCNSCAQATTPSSPNLNCSQQALMENNGNRWTPDSSIDPIDDVTIDELASYLDVFVYIPKKMSPMAEMMYT